MSIAGPSTGSKRQQASSISSEALALSASSFLTSVDSWIPANFGVTRTPVEKEAEFGLFLRAEQGERYGLGHPSLDLPAVQRGGPRGAGLAGLGRKIDAERRAIANAKGKRREDAPTTRNDRDDESEDESRAKSVSKRKKQGLGDMFGGKKKKKNPFASASGDASRATSVSIPTALPSRGTSPESTAQSSRDIDNTISNNDGDAPAPVTQSRSLSTSRSTSPTPRPGHLSNGSAAQPDSSGIPEQHGKDDADENNSQPPSRPLSAPRSTPPRTTGSSPEPLGGSSTFPYDGPRPFGSPVKSKSVIRGIKRSAGVADEDEDEDEDEDAAAAVAVAVAVGVGDGGSGVLDAQDGTVGTDRTKSKSQLRKEKRKRAKLGKA